MRVRHSGVTQGEEETELCKATEMPVFPTNLVRVASPDKYRSRIPQDLIKFYLPKREVTESLRTKSLVEARRPFPAMQLKFRQSDCVMSCTPVPKVGAGSVFVGLVTRETGARKRAGHPVTVGRRITWP